MIIDIIAKKEQGKKNIKINILIVIISCFPIMAFELSGVNEIYSVFFVLLAPLYVYIIGKFINDLFLFIRITRFIKEIKIKIPLDLTTEKFYEICDFIYQPYSVYVYKDLLLLLGYEYKIIYLNQVDTLEFSISSPEYKSNFEWFINVSDKNGKISSYRLYKSLDAPSSKIKNNLEEPLRELFSGRFPKIKILETI